jgi:hypothetical protein
LLIAPAAEACPPQALLQLLDSYPQARSHLAWMPLNPVLALELLTALPQAVTPQEPHLYIGYEQEAGYTALQALQSGWLTCLPEQHSLAASASAVVVPVQTQSWLSLANSLTHHLLAPDADWETRQGFVQHAKRWAQNLRPEAVRRLHPPHLPLRRGA